MRWWSVIVVMAVVAAGTWSLRARAAAGDGGRELSRLVRERTQNVQVLRTQLGKVSVELAGVQRELAVSDRIQSRPDWSDLLAVLDHVVGTHVVIETCKVSEASPARGTKPGAAAIAKVAKGDSAKGDAAGAEPVDSGYVLQISGAASDQRYISELVASMESTGVFERITQQTRRRSLLSGEAVGFDLRAEVSAMVEVRP